METPAGLEEAIAKIRLVAFDFDGVFTDNTVFVFQDGREAVRCSRADGLGLARIRELGVEPVIVSTETNPVVGARAKKLGVECVQGCRDKRASLAEIAAKRGVAMEEVAFVGNDVNDEACLKAAGLAIVVTDSHPDVADLADYVTETPGGRGAVREVCDLFARVLTEARSGT